MEIKYNNIYYTVINFRSFSIQNLKLHLRPHKLAKVKEDFGPFLFTPLKFGSIEKKNNNKVEYVWVIDEPCEVILELSNPLNFELEVTNIVSINCLLQFFFFKK